MGSETAIAYVRNRPQPANRTNVALSGYDRGIIQTRPTGDNFANGKNILKRVLTKNS